MTTIQKTLTTGAPVAALALLAGCGAGGSRMHDGGAIQFAPQTVHAEHGPITTHPIVGQYKVPAGMTPTGGTGYAVANSERSNATIVAGTAAPCGAANAGTGYQVTCPYAAGQPAASNPYLGGQ
ncbi:MAG: hypothetical protein IE922_04060 [Sphingomonadales bacterium]|nr:hypothetical protein [Sphingomonadales bacterium]